MTCNVQTTIANFTHKSEWSFLLYNVINKWAYELHDPLTNTVYGTAIANVIQATITLTGLADGIYWTKETKWVPKEWLVAALFAGFFARAFGTINRRR